MLSLDEKWLLWQTYRNTRIILQWESNLDQVLADLTNSVEKTEGTSASAVKFINGVADMYDKQNKDRNEAITALTQRLRDNATVLATAIDAQAPAQPPVVATE